MNLIPPFLHPEPIDYPESDGQPMSDNTKQFRWIYVLYGNIAAMFHDAPEVFVCGNQNWYPVEGHPEICISPDVYAVFGRPKGDRRSYKQWEENNIPMTVVFEILSPKNTFDEMDNKLVFYEEHGVEEMYIYNPDTNRLVVYARKGQVLRRIRPVEGFVSPRLGIRFDLSGAEMVVFGPDGKPFLSFEEMRAEGLRAQQRAEQESQRAEQESQRAEQESQRAEQESQRAHRAERLAARLAELSRKARRGQATPDELAELDRLEGPSPT